MKVTFEELWVIYKEAVDNKDYRGNTLPDAEDMVDSARKGWQAIVDYINKQRKGNHNGE